MKKRPLRSPIVLFWLSALVAIGWAGEYPKVLTAYLGTTPTLDGYINVGEYADAETINGMKDYPSDTAPASQDAQDLSAKIWYKHDGTNLFFAFDVTDDILYGFDTEKWEPGADKWKNANELSYVDGGLSFFSDGLEIMMNPTYEWDDKTKSVGDGSGWQMIVNTHKSTLGGKAFGGLIEGVPFNTYAWDNYKNWIVNEHMKASIRIKSPEEGRGYIVEWRISPNPCMEISSGNFLDLSQETRVGINFEFEDLDHKSDGPDSFYNFHHVDYLAKVEPYRKSLAKSFATLVITPDSIPEQSEYLSDQLPAGKTMADLGLGTVPFGPASRAVRLVEWATLPTSGLPPYCQQMAAQGDKLYCSIKKGQILEYALDGTPSAQPFLDVATLRGANFVDQNNSYNYGIRGFAFHPGYQTNHLAYTLHRESNTGAADLYVTSGADSEFVLGEWNMSWAAPTMREVFRIGFASGNAHKAQNIGFNPAAVPGDADYGMIYCCFGDNTTSAGVINGRDNGQNFTNVTASVIRIRPLDPSGDNDTELTNQGLKRSANGTYSIPLDNPFVGHPTFPEELFAKGFRNPVTLSFAPNGSPIVGDAGEQAIEEINLVKNGGNYGWSLREGTFAFTMSDQSTGDLLDANDSLTWVPYGDTNDPAYSIYFRDMDGTNPRTETPARSGINDDGLVYPVAQYSHEGNNSTGTKAGNSAIVAGQYYNGFWAEELEGLYIFGDLALDTLYYMETKDLVNDNRPAEIHRLPLIDAAGNSITLESLIGAQRANMRFGRDSYGNVYLVSKTNFKIYRFQGTPEVGLQLTSMELPADGKDYPLLNLTHPGPDSTLSYSLESAGDLSFTNSGAAFVEIGAVTNLNATIDQTYRTLSPFESEDQRFFRPKIQTKP